MLKIDGIQDGYCQAVYIIGDEELVSGDDVLSKVSGDSRLFVKKTNIEGIFTYGCEQLADEYFGHSKGYIWASRASVMNGAFDIALIECNYKVAGSPSYRSCAIDVAHLEELLEETEYTINRSPKVEGIDTDYLLVKKETM